MKTIHDFSIRGCYAAILDARSPAARLEYFGDAMKWAEAEVLRRGLESFQVLPLFNQRLLDDAVSGQLFPWTLLLHGCWRGVVQVMSENGDPPLPTPGLNLGEPIIRSYLNMPSGRLQLSETGNSGAWPPVEIANLEPGRYLVELERDGQAESEYSGWDVFEQPAPPLPANADVAWTFRFRKIASLIRGNAELQQ